jgi:putative ABC transport system substrate-binding protein
MKRREFITGLSSAAIEWPLTARAQAVEQLRRIGVLMGGAANDPGGRSEAIALKQGLQDLGWVENRNLQINISWSGGELDRIQASAKELVGMHCEVIVARSTPVVAALLKETRTIPIVFTAVVDPVGSGFVQSFARPGSNVTGFQNYEFMIAGKWPLTLTELAPSVRRVAYLYNPTTAPSGFLRALEGIARSLSVKLVAAPVQNSEEIDAVLAELAREPGGGLMTVPDVFLFAKRAQVIGLAAKYGAPAIYPSRQYTTSGGLASYGPDTLDLFRRAAGYVNRILKGEKPADLPVQAPTKYELIVNLKTAKAIGITVPPTLLARADEVIE